MTTYNQLTCNVCKRSTEVEVDNTRPTFNQCTITLKCTGKLQKTGTKSVRDQLITAPVAGLKNWVPRNIPISNNKSNKPIQNISITNGANVLTIAALNTNNELVLKFAIQKNTASPFTQFSYFGFTTFISTINGTDSTPNKKILRFSNTDTLNVSLNGINLNRAVKAAGTATIAGGHVTSITIIQEGIGYNSPPIVLIGGNGAGATGTAAIDSNGVVTGVTITAQGAGYSGIVPVSFLGGITGKSVYYTSLNALQIEPAMPARSKLDITVTPFVTQTTANLTFTRHTVKSAGAWSNISTVNAYNLFSCSDLSPLKNENHMMPISLMHDAAVINPANWYFLLSADPHENVDRIFTLKLIPEHANLFRSSGSNDLLVGDNLLSSVYPPIAITTRIGVDVFQNTVSTSDTIVLSNSSILGNAY